MMISTAVKLSCYRHTGDKGEQSYSSYSFSTSALDGGWVVSATPRPRFIPGERFPGTHCTGGWVDLRAGLNTEVRRKSFASAEDGNRIVQFVVKH
jgi:hypothetical protein